MATVYILGGDFPGKRLFFNELNATFYTANRREPLAEAASITDLVVWDEFRSDPLLVALFYLALPVVGWVLQWIASRSPNMVRFIAEFSDGRSLVGSMNKDAFGKLEQMIHGMSYLDAEAEDDEDAGEHDEEDILYPEAVRLVRNERWASVSSCNGTST